MVIEVPESIESRFTPESVALNLAVGMFVSNEVTLGQGAQIARLSQSDFMDELCKRQIPLHYDEQDLDKDLKTLRKLLAK
jgi:predicted HTH domain antitoxin